MISMVEKVDFFEYDTTPTEDNEIVVAFKVREKYCEMKIPEKTLRDMLRWIELKTQCVDCRNEEKNPGLDVCGSCYHKRIWGNH